MMDPRNGELSIEDLQAIEDFKDFLLNPTGRCGICLADDHHRPSQCPEVTDVERRRVGVMRMDVAMAQRVAKLDMGRS